MDVSLGPLAFDSQNYYEHNSVQYVFSVEHSFKIEPSKLSKSKELIGTKHKLRRPYM